MQQYELPLANQMGVNNPYFPYLPLLTPDGYNIVLNLDYEETSAYLIPISDVLFEYYDDDVMMWDMLSVYIRLKYAPGTTDRDLWDFCATVSNDYLNGTEAIALVVVKASFDAALMSVQHMVRLVTDQLTQRNHVLNDVTPSVRVYEQHVVFLLICNCQPAINYAVS